MRFLASPFRTDPVEVFTNAAPEYQDVLVGPNFGSVNNSTGSYDGSYECVIIKMSDLLKYTPSETSDSGNCIAETESTISVCQNGDTGEDESGDAYTCTAGEDIVYLHLSTSSTATEGDDGSNPWAPPTTTPSSTFGFKLTNPWTISGGASATLVMDGAGKVSDNTSNCDMGPPDFSMR